jgi:hypothetical protein
MCRKRSLAAAEDLSAGNLALQAVAVNQMVSRAKVILPGRGTGLRRNTRAQEKEKNRQGAGPPGQVG